MMRAGLNLIVFACLWLLLTEGRVDSWIVGTPTVLAATAAATCLGRNRLWRCSVIGFIRFVPQFARNSLHGGIDVAWRSLHPQLPIHPQLIEYELHLPKGAARVFFMDIINLLPGTVSADLCDEVLTVHVIDDRQPIQHRLEKLEHAVAALFATRFDTSPEEETLPS